MSTKLKMPGWYWRWVPHLDLWVDVGWASVRTQVVCQNACDRTTTWVALEVAVLGKRRVFFRLYRTYEQRYYREEDGG